MCSTVTSVLLHRFIWHKKVQDELEKGKSVRDFSARAEHERALEREVRCPAHHSCPASWLARQPSQLPHAAIPHPTCTPGMHEPGHTVP
jgi:hypothetical protein